MPACVRAGVCVCARVCVWSAYVARVTTSAITSITHRLWEEHTRLTELFIHQSNLTEDSISV